MRMIVLRLRAASSSAWLDTVVGDFDTFMQDHANCERKASATAMSLVMHYADHRVLVDAMISLAKEELDHFEQVYTHMSQRGVALSPDRKDPYVRALQAELRHGRDDY